MWYGCNDTSSAFMDYMTDPPWESHTQQAGGSTDNSVVLVINFFYGAESLKIKPLHSTKNDPWLEGAEALEAFDAGYAAALSRLLKAGRRALFVLANPMKAGEPLFKFNRCIAEKRHPSDCDFHWSKPVLPKVEELVREHPNQLGLFDFSDYACEPPERPPNPSRLCKAVVDHRGVLVDNHFNKDTVLSNRFQQFFAKKLEEELGKLNF
uniref:Uncharacterized protein n=1 Tax=Chromera velia CCMP2878 TaxID=1169474 RepID=A0A0G4I7Q2_9ALVE|eukprot:Cvel_11748.t1-p1 / transcript=Cvel_11748.t1 / gene=Cvel_11748 / organism=Chromera_velia_CCMP2878 / gene_product=hypothetical protein / transcript_product=hypothetical protein / location=Cvel_scaffold746:53608-54231(+) / protein_length=208 / sequence_SO=supercontig / SO=protein_coding / is_pseudo=false